MARTKKLVQVAPAKTAEQIEADRLFEERLSQSEQLAREIVRECRPRLIGVDKPSFWLREEQELRGYRNMLEVVLFLLVGGCNPSDIKTFLIGGDTSLKMLAGFWAELWVRGSSSPQHLAIAQTAHTGDLTPLIRVGWLEGRQIPDVLGSAEEDRHTRDRRTRAREKLAAFYKDLN